MWTGNKELGQTRWVAVMGTESFNEGDIGSKIDRKNRRMLCTRSCNNRLSSREAAGVQRIASNLNQRRQMLIPDYRYADINLLYVWLGGGSTQRNDGNNVVKTTALLFSCSHKQLSERSPAHSNQPESAPHSSKFPGCRLDDDDHDETPATKSTEKMKPLMPTKQNSELKNVQQFFPSPKRKKKGKEFDEMFSCSNTPDLNGQLWQSGERGRESERACSSGGSQMLQMTSL
ncbi:hypothetical protein JOB18_001093 [Solea senegalensis]|uniref:Uncharacterized protein n=1 Tax=Solea senegalensis TaxID=28829 RepID=A0AAV6T2Q4_SOLSE|nr:hypothetical protein JOB18_001093 [Solea senegalensis]